MDFGSVAPSDDESSAGASKPIPPEVTKTAQLKASRIPASDSVRRWSGNEFLVIFRKTDPRALTIAANGVRSFVEDKIRETVLVP